MLQAITFDFWDTLVYDDSDEPKRKAQGLLPKPQQRLQLLKDELLAHHPTLAHAAISDAFDQANTWFTHCWKQEHHTPTVTQRLQRAYEQLEIPLTPGFAQLVEKIEFMEVEISPDFAPGVKEALTQLASHYRLGIISDTIVTPGRGLREILKREGLFDLFSGFVFSDEVGAAKPNAKVFEEASRQLQAPLSAMAHVGDRESNDVEGPLAIGMRGILYTGVIDRGSQHSKASAIYNDHRELANILAKFAG